MKKKVQVWKPPRRFKLRLQLTTRQTPVNQLAPRLGWFRRIALSLELASFTSKAHTVLPTFNNTPSRYSTTTKKHSHQQTTHPCFSSTSILFQPTCRTTTTFKLLQRFQTAPESKELNRATERCAEQARNPSLSK